jgi:hypothetical protein
LVVTLEVAFFTFLLGLSTAHLGTEEVLRIRNRIWIRKDPKICSDLNLQLMKLIIIFVSFWLDHDPDSNPGFESASETETLTVGTTYPFLKSCSSVSFVHFCQFFTRETDSKT